MFDTRIAFGILIETWIGDDTVNLRCTKCAAVAAAEHGPTATRVFAVLESPVDLAELVRLSAAHAEECTSAGGAAVSWERLAYVGTGMVLGAVLALVVAWVVLWWYIRLPDDAELRRPRPARTGAWWSW